MRPVITLLLLLGVVAHAQAQVSVVVDGMCNIFGAGVASPPAPGGGGGGILPVEVDILPGTKMIVFPSITGQVSCCAGNPGTFNGPEGALSGSTTLNLIGGISGIIHDYNTMFLTGVFLGPGVSLPAPPALVFSDNTDFSSISTELGQTFFVGDGLTGTGEGMLQRFMVPAGATRLFLGFTDAPFSGQDAGDFEDNAGELNVQVVPIGFLRISADVDSCNGYADLIVESAEVTGASREYAWNVDGVPLPGATDDNIRVISSGQIGVAVMYIFDGTGSTASCDTSMYIELPVSNPDVSIEVQAADCGRNNGALNVGVSASGNTILTSLDGGPFSTVLEYPILAAGPHDLSIDVDGLCLFDTTVVIPRNKCPVYLPNIFSPNDDGINDHFGPGISDAFDGIIRLFAIYDRGGNLVHRRQNVTADEASWDGKDDGLSLNPGVYTYVIQVEYENGDSEILSGDITMIR